MTEASVIREYAFQLGWNIDEQAFKKYAKVLADTDNSILAVSASLVAAGIGAVAFVDKMSSSMEKLYFATRRTGTTAEEFQQFGLAIQNAGGSADGAASSLQNLAAFLRNNPGGSSWLVAHGVDPKNIGNAKKELDDLATRWKTMPWYQAKAEANVVGIDDQTLLARLDPNYREDDTYAKAYKAFGMNADKATEASHNFQSQLRTMGADFTAFGQWLENDMNGPITRLISLTEKGLQGLQDLIKVGQSQGISAVYQKLGLGKDTADLLATDPSDLIKFGHHNGDLFPTLYYDSNSDAGKAISKEADDLGAGLARTYGRNTALAGINDPLSNAKAKAAYDRLVKDGIPSNQAIGMVGAGWLETGGTFDPASYNKEGGGQGARGIFQLRGDRIDDFKAQYGHDPILGTMTEQLDFAAKEILSGKEKGRSGEFMAAGDPATAGRLFEHNHQRPDSDVADGRAEGYAQHVSVVVNIHGNATENDVRKGVSGGMSDAAAQMTRQFKQ